MHLHLEIIHRYSRATFCALRYADRVKATFERCRALAWGTEREVKKLHHGEDTAWLRVGALGMIQAVYAPVFCAFDSGFVKLRVMPNGPDQLCHWRSCTTHTSATLLFTMFLQHHHTWHHTWIHNSATDLCSRKRNTNTKKTF